MYGSFPLSDVDVRVMPGELGAYILSRDGRTAHYVGRSDDDLKKRIKLSAKEGNGYKYFWFEYARTPMEAYRLECKWCDDYRPTDNTIKPALPK